MMFVSKEELLELATFPCDNECGYGTEENVGAFE